MFVARIFTLYPEFFPGPLAKGISIICFSPKILATLVVG